MNYEPSTMNYFSNNLTLAMNYEHQL